MLLALSLLASTVAQEAPRVVSTPARARPPPGAAPAASTGGTENGSAGAVPLSDLLASVRRAREAYGLRPDAGTSGSAAAQAVDGADGADPSSAPQAAGRGGGRSLLGRMQLTGTNCPYGTVPCEEAPVLLPASGYAFNHAGAVQLSVRLGAEVRYTLDGSEPTRASPLFVPKGAGGGLVELRVDPPCPTNRFSNASKPTYCTFAPRQRSVTLKARTIGRWNSTGEDSAVSEGGYTLFTGRHGRAYLVPYYHGNANEQSPSQRAVTRAAESPMSAGFRRETGLGYSGKLVEVQLNTLPFRRVHLHDVITDFAEYTQFFDKTPKTSTSPDSQMAPDSDVPGLDIMDTQDSDNQFMDGAFSTGAKTVHEFFVTAHGVDPLPVTDKWSHALGTCPYQGQLRVLDLARFAAEGAFSGGGEGLRGFWSGFEATSASTGNQYGFLVPYFDGVSYSGLAVRVDLVQFHNATSEQGRAGSVKLLNLTSSSPRARGFAKGFAHGDEAYFVPLFDGVRASSLVVRVNVDDFSPSSVEVLDLADPTTAATDGEADDDPNGLNEVPRKALAGFQGGRPFVDSTGTAWGLLAPFRNAWGPIHKTQTKLTADGFNARDVMREAEAYGGGHQVAHYPSAVVRFSLEPPGQLANAQVGVLDLATVDPDLGGFSDGVVVGSFLYLVPFRHRDVLDGNLGYFGKVVRIDLESFASGMRAVKVLDLTRLDPLLVGFSAGFSWGATLLLVPLRNANARGSEEEFRPEGNHFMRAQHGKLVGIDLSQGDFDGLGAVQVLDLSTVTRQQIPKVADPELRGFSGGFASGDYAYLVPHSNGVYFGKMVRVDMRDFSALAKKQLQARERRAPEEPQRLALEELEGARATQAGRRPSRQAALARRRRAADLQGDGTDDGSRTGTNSLGHDGVQVLDVQWQDRQLCGFSGGFATTGIDEESSQYQW